MNSNPESIWHDWAREEIERYTILRRNELDPLYAQAEISVEDPGKRAEYLAEVLNLTMEDHSLIMKTAGEKSRPDALKLLEDMAVKFFSETKNF